MSHAWGYIMISFCCALMNRGGNFTKLYSSLLPSIKRDHELVVADFGSDDIQLSDFSVRVVSLALPFRRSQALNATAAAANGDVLFFIDADMLVLDDWDDIVLRNVAENEAFFPICFGLYRDKPAEVLKENGYWRKSGYGMCGFTKADFLRIGGWSEEFARWGGEDDDLFARTKKAGFCINRNKCGELIHQWHPRRRSFKERYH